MPKLDYWSQEEVEKLARKSQVTQRSAEISQNQTRPRHTSEQAEPRATESDKHVRNA